MELRGLFGDLTGSLVESVTEADDDVVQRADELTDGFDFGFAESDSKGPEDLL